MVPANLYFYQHTNILKKIKVKKNPSALKFSDFFFFNGNRDFSATAETYFQQMSNQMTLR